MLEVRRKQILFYRAKVSALYERLARSQQSLERVAMAGLQDSMP